jgi:putative transposase
VKFLCEKRNFSARRACKLVKLSRSVLKYRKAPDRNEKLRKALRRLGRKHKRAGSRMLHLYLKREGWKVNYKRVERLYREERLSLRRKRGKKLRATLRVVFPKPTQLNECWSIDFMTDALMDGRAIRVLTSVDEASTEGLLAEPRYSFPAMELTKALERAALKRGSYPQRIRSDNGPEFTSSHFQNWCYEHGIVHDLIQPGKPYQNAFCESFNGRFRDECLDAEVFVSLDDARIKTKKFLHHYNTVRPKRSLGGIPPSERAAQMRAADTNRRSKALGGSK